MSVGSTRKAPVIRSSRQVEWWRSALAALLVGIATIAVFMPAGRGQFVWDDGGLITQHPEWLDEWSDALSAFGRAVTAGEGVAYYRPVLSATFVADAKLGGAGPERFHRTNVLLHGLNAALVCLVLALYTGSLWASVVGALLFAMHPIQCQAVGLILGRTDELLVAPVVGMLIANEIGGRTGRRFIADCCIVLCYAAALWTKETGIVVPAFLLLSDLLWHGLDRRALRRRMPLFAMLAVVALAYLMVRRSVLGSVLESGQYGSASPTERLALAVASLGYYVNHVVLPWGFAPAPFHRGLVDPARPEIWIAVFVCLGLLATTAIAVRKQPRIAYGLLVLLIGLSPVLGIVALAKVQILEHRTYMPMIGVAFVGATLAARFTRPAARAAIVVGLGSLAALTAARLPSYADSLSLWALGVAGAPESDYARNNYAAALMGADRTPEAIDHLREALRLNPDYDRARYNLAACLEFVGRRPDAIAELRYIIDRRPHDPAVLNRLGLMLGREGQLEAARAAFESAVAIRPEDPVMLRNLADGLAKLGRYEEASAAYRRVTELEPRNADHWRRLGGALLSAGHPDQAVDAFQRVLEIGPESGRLQSDLASVMWRAGRWEEAASHARRARELGYVDPQLWEQLQTAGALPEPGPNNPPGRR
jgi:tetratricopeptide (TPR) repeat protein